MVPLIYHPAYNVTAFGLERLHPFDGRKYGRIHDALLKEGVARPSDFVRPGPITRPELLKVHSAGYLDSLGNRKVIAGILEVRELRRLPAWVIDWRVLRPMRYATGGTLLACRLGLEHGVAINLGGGFHHASPNWGGGFCVYADVPVAVKTLHDEGLVGRVLVVDLDAHQGNGTARAFRDWPWAFILDVYQEDIFPLMKQPEDVTLPIPAGTSGVEYSNLVREAIPEALDAFRPDLLIYNAGSDPFIGDPLAGLALSARDIAERDLFVVTQARERGVPVAMVLSGGYSAESWRIHADAIEGIITRFQKSN